MEKVEHPSEVIKSQEVQENKPLPVEQQAVLNLKGALPEFKRRLENLTGVQAKKVLLTFMEYPYEVEKPTFTTTEAANLFELGQIIQDQKLILTLHSLDEMEAQASEKERVAKEDNNKESVITTKE